MHPFDGQHYWKMDLIRDGLVLISAKLYVSTWIVIFLSMEIPMLTFAISNFVRTYLSQWMLNFTLFFFKCAVCKLYSKVTCIMQLTAIMQNMRKANTFGFEKPKFVCIAHFPHASHLKKIKKIKIIYFRLFFIINVAYNEWHYNLWLFNTYTVYFSEYPPHTSSQKYHVTYCIIVCELHLPCA